MISFAQNAEDVVLSRAFPPEPAGFYIDVGASDPTVDSVTKHFYDHGWSGINVEPAARALAALREARPRDLNLGVGLGSGPGTATFYELPFEMMGCSSFSAELADDYGKQGWASTPRPVEVTTLAEICERHVGERTVDFLKIDVEGDEADVLEGADFTRFRPRAVLVEATQPGTQTPSHHRWEPGLLNAGYEFVLFDGLNRFYVRREDEALVEPLSVPANVLDDYVPFRFTDSRRQADAVEQGLSATRAELARSQAARRDAETELAAARRALEGVLRERRTDAERPEEQTSERV